MISWTLKLLIPMLRVSFSSTNFSIAAQVLYMGTVLGSGFSPGAAQAGGYRTEGSTYFRETGKWMM